jgi:hypothetical protein
VGRIPLSCGRRPTFKIATTREHALCQFRRNAIEVVVTTQNTIEQALERARGLLAYLVEHRAECGPGGAGAKQLQNMSAHVTSIEEWVACAPVDPSNAVRRLRDFSNTIERLKVPDESARTTRGACLELIETFRYAADQLVLRKPATTTAPAVQAPGVLAVA